MLLALNSNLWSWLSLTNIDGTVMNWGKVFRRKNGLNVLARYREDQVNVADRHVVAEALRSGIDALQPQEVRHYLYLPSVEDAHQVAQELGADGYAVDVRKSASLDQDSPNPWLALATSSVILDEKHLEETRQRFEALALRYNGDYDGWEIALRRSS